MSENPVTLRPGRARPSSAPDAIGSLVNALHGYERVNFVRIGNDTIVNDNNDVRFQRNEMRRYRPSTKSMFAVRPTLVELNISASDHPSRANPPESPNVEIEIPHSFG